MATRVLSTHAFTSGTFFLLNCLVVVNTGIIVNAR